MDKIDKYFLSNADKLSYIELKNELKEYKKIGIHNIPLPIILQDLMFGITNNKFNNEISINYIIDGILFNISIDKDFRYINEYKEILKKTVPNYIQYSVNKGIKALEQDLNRAIMFFRAAFILDERNEFAAYNYARVLWNLEVLKDDLPLFVEKSIRILERIIKYNDKYSLAYYELGNINASMGKWIKADSFYRKSLENLEIDEVKEEIRNKIQEISPDVAVENAIYYINRMYYTKAIEFLIEARKNSTRYDIPYYIGISYMNQEKPEIAEKYFEEAIAKGADFSTLYVDYTYIKYILNKEVEALQIVNEALEKYPTDIKLRYNRAIIYIALNKTDKAEEDFQFILEYQDLSDELYNQIMIIRQNLRRENE